MCLWHNSCGWPGNAPLMKPFLICFFTCLSLALRSNDLGSELHLKLIDNTSFTVIFDNQAYQTPCNSFYLPHISAGNHHIQVLRHHAGAGFPAQVLYQGIIHIPGNIKLYTLIDAHKNLRILQAYPAGRCYPENNWTFNPSSPPMLPDDFHFLKTAVSQQAFDSNRLELAMQAISTSCVTTAQVMELARLLTFDTSRLELTKFAYPYTTDKHNYHLLHQIFDFESSIRHLKDYIRTY